MEELKPFGICTIDDLDQGKLNEVLDLLQKRFNEVIFFDPTIRKKELNGAMKILIKDYQNPRYWMALKSNRRDRHKKRLKETLLKQRYSPESLPVLFEDELMIESPVCHIKLHVFHFFRGIIVFYTMLHNARFGFISHLMINVQLCVIIKLKAKLIFTRKGKCEPPLKAGKEIFRER